jgi:hypothetical protein
MLHAAAFQVLYENRKFTNNVDWLLCHVFPLVPKLQLPLLMEFEAGASAQLCSQAGAWEQEAKDLHPIHNIFMLRCDPHGVMGVNVKEPCLRLVAGSGLGRALDRRRVGSYIRAACMAGIFTPRGGGGGALSAVAMFCRVLR